LQRSRQAQGSPLEKRGVNCHRIGFQLQKLDAGKGRSIEPATGNQQAIRLAIQQSVIGLALNTHLQNLCPIQLIQQKLPRRLIRQIARSSSQARQQPQENRQDLHAHCPAVP
jgi:hypothetical protein